MAYKKIPLEEWKKLTFAEQEFYRLEFAKSVERRKRAILWTTRGAAILCILALFNIGLAQIKAAENYGKIFDQYGPEANCYLCGKQNYKECECTYQTTLEYGNDRIEKPNMTLLGMQLGEHNIQNCLPYDEFLKQKAQEAGLNITDFGHVTGPKQPMFNITLPA